MTMTLILTLMFACSLLAAACTGQLSALAAAAAEGAQSAVTLGVSVAGAICLWSGVGEALRRLGLTDRVARLCAPLLRRLFPQAFRDRETAGLLSENFTANLLGLGNAATPAGVAAVLRMRQGSEASDELCRLVVLNTASIQLLPTTVAALRARAGAAAPFDVLPAVWLTSLCSVAAGLLAARLLSRLWRR